MLPPAGGEQPVRRPALLHVASGPRALAEPDSGFSNVFAAPWFAAIYLLLFASPRLLTWCRVPSGWPARRERCRRGPRATMARLPPVRRVHHPRCQPREAVEVAAAGAVSRRGSGSGGRTTHRRAPVAGLGYLGREVGTCGRRATCSSTWPCSELLVSVWRSAGVSVLQGGPVCWCQGQSFADTVSALDEFHPGRFVTEPPTWVRSR